MVDSRRFAPRPPTTPVTRIVVPVPAYAGGVNREARLRVALVLNVVVVAGQVVAGALAHSLGLLADAGHNATDIAALILALIAVRLTNRPATARRSFGYHRSGILAAQANAALLLGATGVIAFEAVRRLVHPVEVHGGLVVVVAAAAMVANGVAALVLAGGIRGGGTHGHAHRHEGGGHSHALGGDMNMRAAVLHMASDAAASAGVLIAGAVIFVTGRYDALDPLVSLGIAVAVGWRALQLLRETTDVLLESTPAGLDVDEVVDAMREVTGVEEVHDLHVWSLSSEMHALSAHLVLDGHPTLEEAQVVGDRVKQAVGRFGIAHATLELECEPCTVPEMDPCAMETRPLTAP